MQPTRQARISLAIIAGFTMISAPTLSAAANADDWIVRGSITNVSPNEDTGSVSGQLSGALAGADVEVDPQTTLGITAAYFVTDRIALELLASTPFEHDLSIDGGALGGTELGSIKHLPPTLSVQYHFDTGSAWRPYVGVGINHTIFTDEDVDGEAAAAGVTDLELDDSTGAAAQVGVDYELGNGWLINAGVRYIDIDTTAEVRTATGKTDVDVDIDPWVTNIGIGYRF
ncbi:MAG: OmpW family outer membrane protein [Anaerolineales bacterium]|nr:OmpW family outer membrane protein [Anaerolineales bacterium]